VNWFDKVNWEALGVFVAAAVALFSIAKALTELSQRTRLRTQLNTEVDIWDKLPDGDEKNLMWKQVQRTERRLLLLEQPAEQQQEAKVSQVWVWVVTAGTAVVALSAQWLFPAIEEYAVPGAVLIGGVILTTV